MKVRKRKRRKEAPPPPEDFTAPESELEELRRQAKGSRAARVALARADVNEFCAFVGKDAETGDPIRQEPIHEHFQDLADEEPFLAVMSHPESGKTSQLGVLRTLWELGHNPNLRFVIVSAKADAQSTAAKIARLIKQYIEQSAELAEVFPELMPGGKWEETFFTVRRTAFSKDPTVQIVGPGGNITGSRIDRVIADDLLVQSNTLTEAERKKLKKWWQGTVIDRLSEVGRVIFMCNAWHPHDLVHEYERDPESGFVVRRFPVLDDEGRCTWPSKWPHHRIEKSKRAMGPLEFARAFMCRARDEGESPFDEESIKAAIEAGDDFDLLYEIDPDYVEDQGGQIYCGVDLAVTKKKGSHLTALSTILYWPAEVQSRQLLWCDAGRWRSDEIADRIIDHHLRYRCVFIVENNGAQRWIIDIVNNRIQVLKLEAELAGEPPPISELPLIIPFTTGQNKAHPEYGVEGLATEIYNGWWLLPTHGTCRNHVLELKTDMSYYVRGQHVGDRLMSMWFAREGARRGVYAGRPESEGRERNESSTGMGQVGASIIG